jgi:hypothetical protein
MGGFSLLDRLDQRLVAVEQVAGDEGRGSLQDSRHQRTIHHTEIRAPDIQSKSSIRDRVIELICLPPEKAADAAASRARSILP